MIDAADIRRVLPGVGGQWLGALHTPSDGRAEPQKVVPALARRARASGRRSSPAARCAASKPRPGGSPASSRNAAAIACSSVVLAGGAWSRLFCRNLDLTLPQLKVLASVMRVDGVTERAGERGALFGLRVPQARRWRLYGHQRHRLRSPTSFPTASASSACSCPWRPPSGGTPGFASGAASSRNSGSRRSWRLDERLAVRAGAHSRSAAVDQPTWTPGCAISRPLFPAFQGATVRQRWAGTHRCDTRCDPGDLRRRRSARVLHRHRFLRPRLRHRSRRRPAHGRHRHRPPAARRPGRVPLLALHRRLAPGTSSPACEMSARSV